MRVLQLCHKPPFPPIDGGCVAMAAVSRSLIKNKIDLFVFSIATPKHPYQLETFPKEIQANSFSHFIDTNLKFTHALRALIKNQSYNISRFYDKFLSKQIINLIEKEKIDVVHIESLFGMPYARDIKTKTKAKIVLRSHNIEHLLWEQKAKHENNPIKKIYLKILVHQLRKFELQSFAMADGIISISNIDSEFIKQANIHTPLITIPVGIPQKQFIENTSNKIYHIGAMDWQPNISGLNWFLNDVWPKVLKKNPDATLHIAGKNLQVNYYKNYKNVIAYGEVKDAEEFAKDKGIMIIPVKQASGIRIKLAEAMMMSKAVVSTSIGASGVENLSPNEIAIADDAENFADCVVELINNENLRNRLSRNAHAFALNNFEENACSKKIIDFYKEILN